MRDTPADLISLKIGINLVNADVMRMRAFTAGRARVPRHGPRRAPGHAAAAGLADLVRHPRGDARTADADLTGDEDGQVRFRATGDPAEVPLRRLTLQVIRRVLAGSSCSAPPTDPHLHYLDGLTLYGEADAAELPLPDDLHPDAATHLLIGERFAATILGSGGAFARA